MTTRAHPVSATLGAERTGRGGSGVNIPRHPDREEAAMAPAVEAPRKHFTVEEANRALPLVRAIVGDFVAQYNNVKNLRERLAALTTRNAKRRPDDPYAEEVARQEAELEAEEAKLAGYVEELTKLGVELKGTDGLCDFPSYREGREIYLCWRLGEPEVAHWHDLHSGFAGRQPLKPTSSRSR
jgi:hypothetical protein